MSNGHTFLRAYVMVSDSVNRLVWNQPRSSLRFPHPNGPRHSAILLISSERINDLILKCPPRNMCHPEIDGHNGGRRGREKIELHLSTEHSTASFHQYQFAGKPMKRILDASQNRRLLAREVFEFFNGVDGEVRDDEICESFRSNHSVQSLLEKREIRVVHRSNNAAHSTSTVFIEVDNQVDEILGQHGRIPVVDLVHRSRTAFLKEINEGNFESRPGPASLPYPPDRRQLSFSLNIEEITTPIIFTDGSKNEAGVGAVIVPSSEDQQPVLLRLHPDCTAFQAELLAIRWAVRLVKEGYSRNAITIASECRSALSAICTSGPVRSTLVAKIILALNTNQNVNLCWVPGHCGIDGKERADRAAKNAAVLILEPSFSILPRSLARNHSRAAALDAWTEVYCQDHYNRHLRRIAHTPDRLLQFLPKDKVLLVKFYYCNSDSSTEALRAFRNFKGIRRGKGPMSCYSLTENDKKFEKTGSLEAKPRMEDHRHASQWLLRFRRMLKLLKRYPRMEKFHELKVGDFEKRQEFAAWVFRQIDIDENWLSNVLWTDEAHFSLNGEVNTQNSRIWATENPRIFTEMPLHQPRVTVWCGFTSSFIIGPFFFEEINGRTFKTVSVTGERYVQLLREKVIPILQDRQALSEITFMQDGGPPHISRGAKQLLKDTFGEDRVISRHFIHQWPSRSPDLTPCDFWLWGYIKSRVYRCRPTTLVMLKASIRRHVSSISSDILFNAVHSVIYRLQAVFENEGCHIEQGL
ncbi:hypothetical protein LAZ67_1002080 [Cordylochernes scorpioides]|uniref:RNase H type-1 domain-containing protein n=1 Tax=Cordylochernes scorpioides TaxID=51811 RepID=A0ABY6JYN7_9ARAC|nr:hypothetical protein LAZ67_1002080 [Cordylochernes scorpioides]